MGAILGACVIGLLQQATGGPDAVFWSIGGAALVSAIAIGSLGPVRADSSAAIDAAPAE
ncbi:MAG TPA: hypothetical protein VMM15_04015 [Bradyrhizobium sp.]|nr:hypothetical protein [Bradyrhizobium sp.]